MLNRYGFAALALLLALSFPGAGESAGDRRRVTEFDVHVGDTFILGTFGQAATDIAGASNGDTIELLFTGRIDTKRNKAEGDGGFRQFDKNGKLLDFGFFTARRLISFLDLGPVAGLPQTWHQGSAKILTHAVGQIQAFNAILQVDCVLGPLPPSLELEEGTFFDIKGGPNFNKTVNETNIFNLFVASTGD
jgi:hypothetical protein